MNPKLKAKWIKALRSGEYRRSTGQLVSSDGKAFCCLGVLADVQGCEWKENVYGDLHPIMPHGREIFATDRSSVKNGGGYLRPRRAGGLKMADQIMLAAMNDEGKTFKQIADYIAKKL